MLLGWRRKPDPVSPMQLRVLRADGQRIDLSSRDTGAKLAVLRQGQAWQADAWAYHRRIGELNFAIRTLARSVAKCRFYAAELRPYPDDPVELNGKDHSVDAGLARDAVDNLARLPIDDDPDGFIAALVRNIAVAGEAWIHGQQHGGSESWTARSISEVTSAGDQVMIRELPGTTTIGARAVDPGREELLRCWVRDPQWSQLADSPLASMMDVLEGIILDGRELRALAQSRFASNGILLVPDTLSLARVRSEAENLDPEAVADDDFMADLTEAMTAPIRNEGDPGTVVPLALRGAAEDLKEVRHLRLERAEAGKITDRIEAGLRRMLKGLDIQPEQVEGVGSVNHWSGWIVEAKDVKHQVAPMAAIIAGCITKAFQRTALLGLGYPEDQVRTIAVCVDTADLVENPNRGQDARDAHDRLVIKDETLRRSLNFDDDDAPDEEELQRRIAVKAGIDQATSAAVLDLASYMRESRRGRAIEQGDTRALPAGEGHTARPGDTIPEKTVPDEPDRSMVASAAPPGWRVDMPLGRALADVDAVLAERILTAADAAVARAVERAGGRARNAVRKDRALAASLEGVDVSLVAATVGRGKLGEFASVPDLLADAFGKLRGQVSGWLADAARAVADILIRLIGIRPGSDRAREIRAVADGRMAVYREPALTVLQEVLDGAAETALFRADQGRDPGTSVTPDAVARVLAVAGGGKPGTRSGGVGAGPVARGMVTDAGGVVLGYEWRYRPELPRGRHFVPHVELDGVRFTTWTDPKLDAGMFVAQVGPFFHPGDHPYCRCGHSLVLAFPEPDDGVVARRLAEAASTDRARLADRVAAEDTAAGRVGTSLQNEVETRERIRAGVERLRAHYIDGSGE